MVISHWFVTFFLSDCLRFCRGEMKTPQQQLRYMGAYLCNLDVILTNISQEIQSKIKIVFSTILAQAVGVLVGWRSGI